MHLFRYQLSCPIMILLFLTLFSTQVYCTTTNDKDKVELMTVAEVRGELSITENSATNAYTAYFHVPVPTVSQVPLTINVTSDKLIRYRLLRTTGNNILVAAYMNRGPTTITWTSSVLIDVNFFDDIPATTLLPTFADLPDSVKPFLQATATAQVDCSPVQNWVNSHTYYNYVASTAESICAFCDGIPGGPSHSPITYDAFSAFTWGSSCTGHAHAATALLRGMGIPARTKLVLLTWWSGAYDMHWTSDYFVPDYGWVGMDTTMDENPMTTRREVVIYQCATEDEFPLFYNNGIDGFWHSSDNMLGAQNPNWHLAHQCDGYTDAYGADSLREQMMALAREAFEYEIDYCGVNLPSQDQTIFEAGRIHHLQARNLIASGDMAEAITEMQQAVDGYSNINGGSEITIYATDFEDGIADWTHGGDHDEWRLGTPTATGPDAPHSGVKCWATNLWGYYSDNAETWLQSPEIDLSGLYSAELEFWIWNDVWGGMYYYNAGDYLTMEISTDGTNYVPFCSAMRSGTIDNQVPHVPGWSQMNLALTRYIGQTVQIRFHFHADEADHYRAGSYIDDFKITGRADMATPVPDDALQLANNILTQAKVFPNPFNPLTTISFSLREAMPVGITIYDMSGKKVASLAQQTFGPGQQAMDWGGQSQDGNPVPSGTYLVRIKAGEEIWQGKMMLVR